MVFPDKSHNHLLPVYLLYNNVRVEEMLFVSCDGGRWRVPLPKPKNYDDGRLEYLWVYDSLEWKVGQIVGIFNVLPGVRPGLLGFSDLSGVKIV